jgi:hypothetical protein
VGTEERRAADARDQAPAERRPHPLCTPARRRADGGGEVAGSAVADR